MATTYSFAKSIQKTYALQALLNSSFPVSTSLNVTDNEVDVETSQPLTSSQAAQLATIINNYTDPAVFLQLNSTQTMPSSSVSTSSSTLTPVMTFIFTNQTTFDQALDGIKTIIQVSSANPQTVVTSPVLVTINIFDITRNIQVASQVVDMTSVVTNWQQTVQTGPATGFMTAQFTGIMNKTASYDCIWQFQLSVTDPNVSVNLNALQYLLYDVM
ncbi:hypothetical protein CVIRNUC_003402 [Coccomyxa viridis]|uniref:Uncharacterized protein n=1 Tax=Coccomyxa viridis TaxID=1274662 RepID=A0AAV1HZQ9_9CHLO|nr:hypothetical protein CVIRNUC_003402 [Coccomyxa viridis]